jgi:hypothetical protein
MFQELTDELLELTVTEKGYRAAVYGVNVGSDGCSGSCSCSSSLTCCCLCWGC